MQIRKTALGLAAALAVLTTLPVQAQSSKEIEELRNELRALRQELDALKREKAAAAPAAAKPADNTGWGERIEQVELKQKDAVVAGDIAGGFRLPGSETSMRIYGYAEAHALTDLKQWASPDNFTNLSGQPISGQRGRTKFTAETSRFGIETSTPTSLGAFNAKVEADFYSYGSGNRNRLRLRHAYGEYGGFLVGQTWSTFMDVDNLPETVDFNGPIGAPFSRRAMVRYTYGDPTGGYKFTFALEDPEDQFGGGSARERLPQVVGRFDKSFSRGSFNVRVLAHEKRSPVESKMGFGIGIGGSFKLTDSDLLMGQVARVDGDVDQMYGSNGHAIDGNTGRILFDKNYGLVLGWAHTFSEKLRSNLVFGMNHSNASNPFLAAYENPADDVYANKRLRQLHVDLIYSPIKNVELGAEFVWGKRRTYQNGDGTMSRFDLMGRYSF